MGLQKFLNNTISVITLDKLSYYLVKTELDQSVKVWAPWELAM